MIRNFELMGRVNLDQLELLKEQESSCEDEDERNMMEMVGDGSVAGMEDDEEEEAEEEEEDQDVMASVQEEGEMEDEEMEGIKEEEEEPEEDVGDEAAEGRRPVQGGMIANVSLYLTLSAAFSNLELTDHTNSISQKPLRLRSAAQERAVWRSASPASSAAAASPTAWSGSATSCATACECVRSSFLLFL